MSGHLFFADESYGQEIDLRQFLRGLWRRRLTIGVTMLVAVLAAVLASFLLPPVYEVRAVIQLSGDSAPAYATQAPAAQVVTSAPFLTAAAVRAGIPERGEVLQSLVIVQPVRDTRMMRLRVRGRTARQAQALAEAIVQALLTEASTPIEQQRTTIQRHLDTVTVQMAETQRLLDLSRETLAQMQRRGAFAGDEGGVARSFMLNALSISADLYNRMTAAQHDLRLQLVALEPPIVVDPPLLPEAPVALRRVLNISLATVVGLLVGVTLAAIREYVSTSVPVPAGSAAQELAQQGVPRANPGR